jgi:predicted enzyme related to lactoylglutathione lyase
MARAKGTTIAALRCSMGTAERTDTMNLNALMVRYIVNDVEASIAFYQRHFGFRVAAQSGPDFALLEKENLQLVLSPPKGPGGGSQPMADGRRPEPGGWNRMIVKSTNLDADVAALKKSGAELRNEIVTGPGGRQILVQDPSGNLVELFEPAAQR